MIKSLPLDENPREKAMTSGIEQLSNVELLAILLRCGTKEESVLELSARLLKEVGGIENLRHVSYHKLTSLKGIKKAKALEILAMIELAKRMKVKKPEDNIIRDPMMAYHYLSDMESLSQEHVVLLILDSHHRLISRKTMFVGSVDEAMLDVREVYRQVLSCNGVALIVAHNHPSGDITPSREDLYKTEQLCEASEIMKIKLLDHLIIGHDQYYSILGKKTYKIRR